MYEEKRFENIYNEANFISKDVVCDGTILMFMNENHPCVFEWVDEKGLYGVSGRTMRVTTSPVVRVLKKISNPKTGGGYYEFLTQAKDGTYHRYTIYDRRGE